MEERENQGRLILQRRIGEVITIGDNITVTVSSIDKCKVRLAIRAPRSVPVFRKEIQDKIDSKKGEAVP